MLSVSVTRFLRGNEMGVHELGYVDRRLHSSLFYLYARLVILI